MKLEDIEDQSLRRKSIRKLAPVLGQWHTPGEGQRPSRKIILTITSSVCTMWSQISVPIKYNVWMCSFNEHRYVLPFLASTLKVNAKETQ